MPARVEPSRQRRLEHAVLMKRACVLDVLTCSRCQGPMRLVSVVQEARVARELLDHLGPTARAPARERPWRAAQAQLARAGRCRKNMALVAVVLAFIGCNQATAPVVPDLKQAVPPVVADLCQRTVQHLMAVMYESPGDTARGERLIIEAVGVASVATCRTEGLSQAQADCVLAVRGFDQLMRLGTCPALREKRPSWIQLPPTPEEMEQIKEKFRQRAASPDASTNQPAR